MTCDHCRGRVDTALKTVSGVYGVYVDLEGGFAEVDFDDSKTHSDALIDAVKSVGYEAELSP
jgi:copper chaperone